MNTKVSRVFVILNPNSGVLKPWFRWINRLFGWSKIKRFESPEVAAQQIKAIFESNHINCVVQLTKEAGDATRLAKHVVKTQSADTVVAVGGDGTINEVINGLVGSNIKLGVIPYGTANVFGLSFGLPTEVATATERIINGKIKAIDVGSVNNHYFVCMAGVGFDAYIIKKAEQSLKKTIGALSYVFTAVWEYLRYRFHPILFKVDNHQKTYKGYFLVISNTKYYGGKYVISNDAEVDDGKLDICLIKHHGLLNILICGVQMALGKLNLNHQVEIIQCSSIRIRGFGRHRIHCDAEYVGHTPAEIKVHHKALSIIH